MNQLQRLMHIDKYSRWIPEENRRETWNETCDRVVEFFKKHTKTTYPHAFDKIPWKNLRDGLCEMKALPAMRVVQMAGPALERDNLTAYNCAALPLQDWKAFGELLYILMGGTGCGFSVEADFIDRLPRIKKQKQHNTLHNYTIADSTEGWCDALVFGLETWANGDDVEFDFSNCRPSGAILKTKGGRASGPEPLKQLLQMVKQKLLSRQGSRLTSLDCHDIACMCGNIVQVGGVRRAAEISLSDLDDTDVRDCKQGAFWNTAVYRSMANNSAVYEEKPSSVEFMEEWLALMKSGTGERGIFNRGEVNNQIPTRRKKRNDWLVNPCVTGDTKVLTDKGYLNIELMAFMKKKFNVWNGEAWAEVTPFSTGVNELVKVSFDDGTSLTCTPYHKFVLADHSRVIADELQPGQRLGKFAMPVITDGLQFDFDMYSQGFYSGDGLTDYMYSFVYVPKYPCMKRLKGSFGKVDEENGRVVWRHGEMKSKTWIPHDGNLQSRLDWLAGLLDADGTVTRDKNGNGFQLTSVDKQFLLDVRLMLTTMGCQAKVVKGHEEGERTLPDGRGGYKQYECQKVWRLLINNLDAFNLIKLGLSLERLKHNGQPPQRDARRFVRVVSVENLDTMQETFCFTEPTTHRGTFNGIVTGQCGEIYLRPFGLCNLSIAVARPDDTFKTLSSKLRLATIWGTLQSTLTDFKYVRPEWKTNAEEERLLGVDITGQWDSYLATADNYSLHTDLPAFRKLTQQVNEEFADLLGINRSVAITCVKPSGNSSQFLDCSSGVHPRYAPYYIRRLRIGANTPVGKWLQNSGIKWSPEVGQSVTDMTVMVVDFPCESPNKNFTSKNIKALDMLDYWSMWKKYYTEHNPSVTIYVEEDEWLEVGNWVYKNWHIVGGLSFLPKNNSIYQLAPYEEITKQQFEKLSAEMPQLNFVDLQKYELEDSTELNREYACLGNSCEL